MTMQVRANYINPLSMKKQQPNQAGTAALKPDIKDDPAEQLQMKRQQLQNQILLLKATGTDTADLSAESQKELESALEEIDTALRAAKSEITHPTATEKNTAGRADTPKTDTYGPGAHDAASFGSYHLEKDDKEGYQIIFSPYHEA